jgi:hypothetical protein
MSSDLIFQIMKPEVQDFIFLHENEDEKKLVLKEREILGIPSAVIASQISGRRKAKFKLPLWFKTKGIIYPPSLNLEQSSSESTARLKASLIKKGNQGADLTGGFGIDTYFLSQRFKKFYYVELNPELLAIAKHNHSLLNATNIKYIHTSAEDYITQTKEIFDLIYIDPSRRNKQQKVFRIADCAPNVTELSDSLFQKSKQLLIKTSPLLDIKQGHVELRNVQKSIVVALDNECKEVLFLSDKSSSEPFQIEALDIDRDSGINSSFRFFPEEEKKTSSQFSPPQRWIYEPHTSILKAGAFKLIGSRYGIHKLHPNTHLYTSDAKIESFPGRIFRILNHLKLDKKIKEFFSNGEANILIRNFPLSVEEIKKKTGIKEGGTFFLICTQSDQNKHALMAERIN